VQQAVLQSRVAVFFLGESTWSLVAAWGVLTAALVAVLIGTYSLVYNEEEKQC